MGSEVEVQLRVSPICYRSRGHPFEISVFFSSKLQPIRVITNGSVLDATSAILYDRIEIIDTLTNVPINGARLLFSSSELENSSSDAGKKYVTLGAEAYRIDYSTVPTEGQNQHLIDPTFMQSGREYVVRFNNHGISWWQHDRDEDTSKHGLWTEALISRKLHLLRFVSPKEPTFRVLDDLPSPPAVSVSLRMTSPVFHLSGDPPFTVTLAFISHAKEPVTILEESSALYSPVFDVVDFLTGKRVGLDTPDHGPNNGPFTAANFQVLQPGIPFLVPRTLNVTTALGSSRSSRTSSIASARGSTPNLLEGDTRDFVKDRRYLLQYKGGKRTDNIDWWSFDPITKILEYAGDRENSGLPYVPPIELGSAEEWIFQAKF